MSRVESVVHQVLERRARKHVGIAVGVRHGGETAFVGRGRVADDRSYPPDERTIFEIGSITKVVTATLLADLAREGVVALDEPVQKHLPDGVVIPVRGRPITLADLASHTSGLPRVPKGFLRIARRGRANPYASYTVEQLHAAVPATKPRREPGRKVRYSNHGMGLLGHVLALRTGKTYETPVAERITGPLGMADTQIAFRPRSSTASRRATTGAAARPRTGTSRRSPGRERSARPLPTSCASSTRRPATPRVASRRQCARRGRRELPAARSPWASAGSSSRSMGSTGGCCGTTAERAASAASPASSRAAAPAVVVLSNSARVVDQIGLDIARMLSTGGASVRRTE